jgi:UDP-N-acetylmuramate--alanine ligase
VLTNVELDHHDRFASLAELEEVYRAFLATAPRAVMWDRPTLRALRDPSAALAVYDVPAPVLDARSSRWRFGELEVTVGIPGAHNALNGAAALTVAELVGVDVSLAAEGLARFAGTGRRFQRLGRTPAGSEIYDDYAHHPTEIAATIAAARTLLPRRLIVLFQPHLYSRTRALADRFGSALSRADAVVVVDVYAARERAEDFPGVSGRLIADATRAGPGEASVSWLGEDRAGAVELVASLGGVGDLVVVMGAGDVGELGEQLVHGGGGGD